MHREAGAVRGMQYKAKGWGAAGRAARAKVPKVVQLLLPATLLAVEWEMMPAQGSGQPMAKRHSGKLHTPDSNRYKLYKKRSFREAPKVVDTEKVRG